MCKSAQKKPYYLALCLCFVCVGFGTMAEEVSLEDPTKPSDFVGAPGKGGQMDSGDLHLDAIIVSGTYKAAVINQKIVIVGDTVGTKKVIAIEDYKVILREGKNKDSVLPLFDANEKIKEASS